MVASETEPGLSKGPGMALTAFWLRGMAKTSSEVARLFGCHGYLVWILMMHKLSDLLSGYIHSHSTSVKSHSVTLEMML